ncbi:MAG: RNA-directed DNA polymerase [Salinivirgaceae bacterium]|nr:RNA-directed DNA polymerase [Salinivirgaceae bacterium]
MLNETLTVGNYQYFTIYDPKKRLICAASFPERVLHHAIMNVCHPVFEKFQIFDSYATRPVKGQYAALLKVKSYCQNNAWFCKLDVRKYFDSIDHELLLMKLTQKFKDKRLLCLFDKIIQSYEVSSRIGIPIGNLTSQYFANFYLGFADHYMKEALKVHHYVRYMDDMVFFSDKRSSLLELSKKFTYYIDSDLQLKIKTPCIQPIEKGLPFLGYVIFNDCVRLNKNSKKRFFRKFQEYGQNLERKLWSQKEYVNHITPLFAFVKFANTESLRDKMLVKWKYADGLEPRESWRQLEQQC